MFLFLCTALLCTVVPGLLCQAVSFKFGNNSFEVTVHQGFRAFTIWFDLESDRRGDKYLQGSEGGKEQLLRF